jgi:formiminotetrahydrofolate cyclodeaminase
MSLADKSCRDFIAVLAGKEPVPGGGGASALVGAIGIALGNMVGSLTTGKKKYAGVEEDIQRLKKAADTLQDEFITLIQRDAEGFEPLSRVYSLPKETAEQERERAKLMEAALKDACAAPLAIMGKCGEAIKIIGEFAAKGSTLALSDAGVGAAFCKAALEGASLNVYINTAAMTDRTYAQGLNQRADALIAEYGALADRIFAEVRSSLQK